MPTKAIQKELQDVSYDEEMASAEYGNNLKSMFNNN